MGISVSKIFKYIKGLEACDEKRLFEVLSENGQETLGASIVHRENHFKIKSGIDGAIEEMGDFIIDYNLGNFSFTPIVLQDGKQDGDLIFGYPLDGVPYSKVSIDMTKIGNKDTFVSILRPNQIQVKIEEDNNIMTIESCNVLKNGQLFGNLTYAWRRTRC
jgi:hypothetical protein